MKQDKLTEVLRLHKLFLDGGAGKRADLSNADLSNANLRYVDLSNANLSNVDLSDANLSDAKGTENETR